MTAKRSAHRPSRKPRASAPGGAARPADLALQSFRKFVQAFGAVSQCRSKTSDPALVSSMTLISFSWCLCQCVRVSSTPAPSPLPARQEYLTSQLQLATRASASSKHKQGRVQPRRAFDWRYKYLWVLRI